MPCHEWHEDRLGRLVRWTLSGVRKARPSRSVRRRVMGAVRQDRSPVMLRANDIATRVFAPSVVSIGVADEHAWRRGRLALWWVAL